MLIDGEELITYSATIVATSLFVLFVGVYVSVVVSKKLFPKYYEEMSENDKWTFRINFASVVSALVIAPAATYILLTEDLRSDIFWYDSHATRLLSSFVIGYMISDTVFLMFCDTQGMKKQYYCHHAAAILGCGMVVVDKLYAFHTCLRMFNDISTPFVHIRWALLTWKKKDTPAYLINGLIFAILFFVGRIATIPLCYATLMNNIGTDAFYRIPIINRTIFLITTAVFDLLNIYWFYSIMRVVIKTMRKAKTA